jgi:hypothetical protein
MKLSMLKQLQIVLTLGVLCATPTLSWAARGGGGASAGSVNRGGNANRNVNANTNVNRNVNANTNVNRNVNVNTNVNRNVNVNTNVNRNVNGNHYGYGGGCCYYGRPVYGNPVYPAAYAAAAIVATAVVVGSIVNTLPVGCTTVYRNGFAYQQCGSTYYQPQFSGSSTTYIVVNNP